MRRAMIAMAMVVALGAGACGDDGGSGVFGPDPSEDGGFGGDSATTDSAGASDGSDATPSGPGGPDDITPEAGGALAMNTMRIGDRVWERTLPMTSGQCFLYEDDGTLPTSATVWGPTVGDEGSHLAVNHNQDGTFEAQVDSDGYYWIAGQRNSAIDDLTIELDFDALTITGAGVFVNAVTGEWAQGSFALQCDPEDQ